LFDLICFNVKQSEVQNIEVAELVIKVCLKLSFNSDGLTTDITLQGLTCIVEFRLLHDA